MEAWLGGEYHNAHGRIISGDMEYWLGGEYAMLALAEATGAEATYTGMVDLTLWTRSVATTLESRSVAFTVHTRSVALTVDDNHGE